MNRVWSRSPEGLRTLTTVIKGIFVKIFPEANEHTVYRISKNSDGVYHVTSNIFQQLVCTLIVLATSIHSLFSIRLLFQMNLKSNPSEAFAVIYGMMKHCFPTVWFYTFWIGKSSFVKLILVCQANSASPSMYFARCVSTSFLQSDSTSKRAKDKFNPEPRLSVEWKLAVFCRLAVLFGATKILIETGKTYMNSQNTEEFFWKILTFNAGAALYNYKVENTFEKQDKSSIEGWTESQDFYKLSYMCIHVVFGAFYDYIGNMVDVFCFIGAAIIFSICERFEHEIPKIKEDNNGTTTNPIFLEEQDTCESRPSRLMKVLEKMSVDFMELSNVEEAANGIFGPVLLLYILGAFPSLAGFMMFKQRSSITGETFGLIAVVYSVLMHSMVSMTASEGSSKIGDYKCWLFDVSLLRIKQNEWNSLLGGSTRNFDSVPALSNAILSRLNHLHREASSSTIGLKGCGFLVVTHGLIGTMLGIFVTFAIVIVQFEMDAPKEE